jgi:esterase/lipase
MKKTFGTLFVLIIVFLMSCATFNHKNPYPNMHIVAYGENQGYVFPVENSNKLIINLEGSGWNSVLGVYNGVKWTETHLGAQLLQELDDKYTILIPEKLKRQWGSNYENDMYDREHYTAENLVACYSEVINGYLNESNFTSIIIVGISEGAFLTPLIYNNMDEKNKANVKAIVSCMAGGLSLYEDYEILVTREGSKEWQEWVDMYKFYLEEYKPGKEKYLDSWDEIVNGTTFRWWNSMRNIRPFDYYKNIEIPVIFFHGYSDYNIPVESTAYVADNLKDKPFYYKIYEWGHQPKKYTDKIQFRKDIAKVILEIDN